MGSPTPIPPSGSPSITPSPTPTPPPTTPAAPPAAPVAPPPSGGGTTIAASEFVPDDPLLYDLQPGRITINETWFLQANNETDLKRDLHDIEFTNADISRKFSQDALGQLSNVLRLFNDLFSKFLSNKFVAATLSAPAQQVNNQSTPMDNAIQNHQPQGDTFNQATADYNTAVDDFNTKLAAGFANDAERDAAINEYNTAANTYNAAMNTYNASANATNAEITAYNNNIPQYNAAVDQANIDINAENVIRAQQGLPPLALQEYLAPKDLVEVKTNVPLLPTGVDPAGPVANATPVEVPQTQGKIIDPGNQNFKEDFLEPFFDPFALPTFAYISTFDRLWDLLLENRTEPFYLDKGVEDIVRPDQAGSDVDEGGGEVKGESAGGFGMASKALGLGGDELEAALSTGIFEQMFKEFNRESPTALLEIAQPFTLGFVIRNALRGALPGLSFLGSDLSSINLEGPGVRLAMALGAVSSTLGILKSNDLKDQVGPLIDEIPGLENLTPDEKLRLSKDLSSVLTNEVLKVAVGLLSEETGSVELLNSLDAGLLLGNPDAAAGRFGLVEDSFAQILEQQGGDGVAIPLGDFVSNQLINLGVTGTDPARIGNLVASEIGSNGLPASREALEDRSRAISEDVLGEGANPELGRQIADAVSLFGIAGATKESLQDTLIGKVGPAQALDLTDEVIVRLFGFSVDFGESKIVERAKDERGANSVVRAVKEHVGILKERDDSKLADAIGEEFDDAQRSITDLSQLLSEILDPGQQFFGLMYEGARGSSFERGHIDIKAG